MESKKASTAKYLLGASLIVAGIDFYFLKDMIGRVFNDPSNFIADLMYIYMFLFSYALLNFTTGLKFGKPVVQFITAQAEELIAINGTILVMFFLLGQGQDVLTFVFQCFVGYTGPQGLLAFALDMSLDSSQKEKEEIVLLPEEDEIVQNLAPAEQAKQQEYSMV